MSTSFASLHPDVHKPTVVLGPPESAATCYIMSLCPYPPVLLLSLSVAPSLPTLPIHLTNSPARYSVLVTAELKDVSINKSSSKEGMMPSGGGAFFVTSSRPRILRSSDPRVLSSLLPPWTLVSDAHASLPISLGTVHALTTFASPHTL